MDFSLVSERLEALIYVMTFYGSFFIGTHPRTPLSFGLYPPYRVLRCPFTYTTVDIQKHS